MKKILIFFIINYYITFDELIYQQTSISRSKNSKI